MSPIKATIPQSTSLLYAFTASVESPFSSKRFNSICFPNIPPFALISSTANLSPLVADIP
jgi:hypothetical protein